MLRPIPSCCNVSCDMGDSPCRRPSHDPRLTQATEAERANWQLIGGGYAIEWPDLDGHIGVAGLLAGHRSGESEASLNRWVASRGNV